MNSQMILMRAESRAMKNNPILIIALLVPLLIILLFRLGYPVFEAWLRMSSGFDLTGYRVLMLSILALITPMMVGMLTGFMLLDDKEDHVLEYISVTPLKPVVYLRWRILAPLILSGVLSPCVLILTNLAPVSLAVVLGATLMASLEAPLLSMLLALVCQNKVEGLAVAKAAGVLFFAPIAAWFLPEPWSGLMYLVPCTWVSRFFWGGEPWLLTLIFIGGMLVHLGILRATFKKLN